MGLVSLILGIISIPLTFCTPYGMAVGMAVGVAAVVLGILGIHKANAGEADNRGQALAGLICGSVGLVLSISVIAWVVSLSHT
jgi:hypothetical protein